MDNISLKEDLKEMNMDIRGFQSAVEVITDSGQKKLESDRTTSLSANLTNEKQQE